MDNHQLAKVNYHVIGYCRTVEWLERFWPYCDILTVDLCGLLSASDAVEAHCYVVIASELILLSKYVAESINQTTDCRTFQSCTYPTLGYCLEVPLIHCSIA